MIFMSCKKQVSENSSGGFTIVELIVVVGLTAVISLFLAYLVGYQYQIYNTQAAQLSVTSDARGMADDIDSYVRQAHRVLSSYLTYTTGSQTLVLQVPSIDSSGQIISGTYDTVVFYLSGTDFYRQVFPDASSSRPAVTKKLASGIDTANFSLAYNSADVTGATQVTSNIALVQTVGGQTKSITFSSQADLRNY